MRISILLAFLTLSIAFACKKTGSPEQQEVTEAIRAYDAAPSDSAATLAYTNFEKYLAAKGFGEPSTPELLLEMARVASAQKDYERAFDYYQVYLTQYTDRPDQADRLYEAIGVAENLGKPELNDILYKSFDTRFHNDSRTSSLTAKIQQKDIAVDSILKFIGKNMFNDSTFRLNEPKAALYIQACEAAVMANPNISNAAEFLSRAAETATTLRDIPKALELYNWIIEKYPTHPRASMALFLKAFTYDNELNDLEAAKKYYSEYLEKYPNDEYAESAKFLIQNLGKSDEELIKMLQKDTAKIVQ